MEMIRVNSTAIIAIGYDQVTQRMKIAFHQGRTYDFCRVPAHVFKGLLESNSKGAYYNNHIKDRYDC